MKDVIKFRGVIDYITPDSSEVRSHLSGMFDTAEVASAWVYQEESALIKTGGLEIINRGVLRYTTITHLTIEKSW